MGKIKRKKAFAARGLTPRQMQILTFIRDYQRIQGYSPTMQELADELGISKVTVFEHVEMLVAKKLLNRSAHKARSLELTSSVRFPDQRPTVLQLAGRIAAGRPIEAIEAPETIDLEAMFAGSGDRFVLKVQGDSMIDEQIRDGDYVVVEKRSDIRRGDTVVAVLEDGDATLKKFYRERGGIRLQPANPAYEPIVVKKVDIQGVVVGVIRAY